MRSIAEIKVDLEKAERYTAMFNAHMLGLGPDPSDDYATPFEQAVAADKYLYQEESYTAELILALVHGISLDRLAEICTAENAGCIMVQPVKVGDMIFKPCKSYCGKKNFVNAMTVVKISQTDRKNLTKEWCVFAIDSLGQTWGFTFSDIGKIVFRTPEAAQAALKGDAE